jgi:hypothetical protein
MMSESGNRYKTGQDLELLKRLRKGGTSHFFRIYFSILPAILPCQEN